MSKPVVLRPLTPDDAPACDAIIAGLPYFFGDPQGVRDCAAAVRTQSGIVALAGEVLRTARLSGVEGDHASVQRHYAVDVPPRADAYRVSFR